MNLSNWVCSFGDQLEKVLLVPCAHRPNYHFCKCWVLLIAGKDLLNLFLMSDEGLLQLGSKLTIT